MRIKSYARRRNIRIPFEPEAIGHTDAPTTFWGLLKQRLRWDGDLYFLYVRKHKHSLNPSIIGWPNFLMALFSVLVLQIVFPFVIIAYTLMAIALLPLPSLTFLFGLIYLLYLGLTVVLYVSLLVMVSERPRQDLKLVVFLPVFPIFMMVMRCWSAIAILNEAWRRGHEESSMAPWWVLKKATRF
jgi:cellulose synthase/poly-beta-1,6-N-acetylglucosamine synthase-like glycosyltransferase